MDAAEGAAEVGGVGEAGGAGDGGHRHGGGGEQVGGAFHQVFEQVTRSVWTYLIDDFIEGFNPFGGFLGVEVVWCFYSWFQHEGTP